MKFNFQFNFNILVIILLLSFPFGLGIKKLIEHLQTAKKRERVRLLLSKEPNKKIIYSPSKSLVVMSTLMTPKYFANIFYKDYLQVTRYNTNEKLSIKKYLNMESSQMESNYFFNMHKNKMGGNFFMKNSIPPKFYNNFVFPELGRFLDKELKMGYPKNILNIFIIIVGDSLHLPTQFFKNDVFICSLFGSADITHIEPSVINELDPFLCFPFTRKRIEDIETKHGMNELREGDFIYIPNGTIFDFKVKTNQPTQIFFFIEFDNFQRDDKIDNEIDIIKLEQIQLRKIPRKLYPKNLNPDELELLWIKKIINGNIWEKNQVINNIL